MMNCLHRFRFLAVPPQAVLCQLHGISEEVLCDDEVKQSFTSFLKSTLKNKQAVVFIENVIPGETDRTGYKVTA
jgi:hypothetical protein